MPNQLLDHELFDHEYTTFLLDNENFPFSDAIETERVLRNAAAKVKVLERTLQLLTEAGNIAPDQVERAQRLALTPE